MLDHAYTVHRLRQMGESHRIAEIGGGYGCLALLLNRVGYESISVFDLPWVQVLQGYFLLMSLPPGTVSLYGEEDVGAIRLQPYWEFHDLADASIDYVINTNSLPEMAHEDRVGYIDTIRRVAKKAFFSINQESGLRVGDYDPQSSVSGLIAQARWIPDKVRTTDGGWARVTSRKYSRFRITRQTP